MSTDIPTTYHQHLACLGATDGKHCITCNRDVTPDEVYTHHADFGWRHIRCGRYLIVRNGRPYCEGPDCNGYPDPIDMRVSDPLSAEG